MAPSNPQQIPRLANIMGLRYSSGTTALTTLMSAMASSPVAIFGNYHNGPGATLMHATLAFKLRGNSKSAIDLYVHGYDPQVTEPGSAYRYDFLTFHDPNAPLVSVLKRVDYMLYC